MIRPLIDQTTLPEDTTGTRWSLDELPPELDYFRASDAYQVELSSFQGPMDLLLYLIQKDEIDIYDIPIAHITEQFIGHIEVMKIVSLDLAGEFMATAAMLLVIKMKMLMPRHGESEDEIDADDPRAELVRRLLEYKRFKEAAASLRKFEAERRSYHLRASRYPFVDQLDLEPELRIEMFDLLAALAGIFERVTTKPVHEIQREPFTVDEKMKLISTRLQEAETVRFEDLFADDAIKMEVIVTFIAILELVKRGRIEFFQTEVLGPIWIQEREQDVADTAADEDSGVALRAREAQA